MKKTQTMELAAVAGALAVLFTLSGGFYAQYTQRVKDTRATMNVTRLYDAALAYKTDGGGGGGIKGQSVPAPPKGLLQWIRSLLA